MDTGITETLSPASRVGRGRYLYARGRHLSCNCCHKDQYIGQVSKAAQGLIDQGYLLQEDLAVVVKNAARHWDYIASTASPSTASALTDQYLNRY